MRELNESVNTPITGGKLMTSAQIYIFKKIIIKSYYNQHNNLYHLGITVKISNFSRKARTSSRPQLEISYKYLNNTLGY